MSRYYLTVGREKHAESGKYLAVLSFGQPQTGDENITVLSIELVRNYKEAKQWAKRMEVERPWETRQ
jgi:hypothetical protein